MSSLPLTNYFLLDAIAQKALHTMVLDALDSSPPPFFRQGPSHLSRLLILLACSLLLMVTDMRWPVTQNIRLALQTTLTPIQWVLNRPLNSLRSILNYAHGLDALHTENQKLHEQLLKAAATSAHHIDLLTENKHLRNLLRLKASYPTIDAQAAQITQKNADPFSHKVLLNKGLASGVALSSPVLGAHGVIGQITRVFPFSSELTLIDDQSFVIPVINTRTGNRDVAFGSPNNPKGNIELRFNISSTDVRLGDVFTTSAIDGIYPPGLTVATVVAIEDKPEAPFSKIYLQSSGQIKRGRHVLVLSPQTSLTPAISPPTLTPQSPPLRPSSKSP